MKLHLEKENLLGKIFYVLRGPMKGHYGMCKGVGVNVIVIASDITHQNYYINKSDAIDW